MINDQAQGKGFDSARFEALTEQARQLTQAYSNVNKELHLASSNVAGLNAIQEAFRGIIGGAEAVGGVFGLLTGDEKQAAEITKNLIAAQSILNGVTEVGSLLSKNSALNTFLRTTILAKQAKVVEEAAIAEEALTVTTEETAVAQTESVVATEAATVAQEELNVAMLANPAGLILAAIVALFGAYELLAHTVFKTSDAEKARKASLASLKEAEDKAAETIGEEVGQLNILVETAKNKVLSDEDRARAIGELVTKYPQYLSNLNSENIFTKEASEAIEKQTALMKARALEQAAEQVYMESLKEQLKKQNELLVDNDSFWSKLWATVKTGNTVPAEVTLLTDKLDALDDATIKVDASFGVFTDAQKSLSEQMHGTTDEIKRQGDEIFGIGKKFSIQPVITDAFDEKSFDENKKKVIAAYQERADAAQKGTSAELKARQELIAKQHELDLKDPRLFRQNGVYKGQPIAENADAFEKAKAAQGQFISQMQDLNEQITAKALQNATSAASALVLILQAAGQQGSEAYFNAQAEEMRKAARQQIIEAKDNAGEVRKIEAQLALDLVNLDKERQRQKLENEKSSLEVQLNLAKVGSEEELALRMKLIDNAADEQLIAAGKNEDKILEIHSNAEKQKTDLSKKFAVEAEETRTNIAIAGIETQLAAVASGTAAELNLKKELIEQKAILDIDEKKKQIKNEELLAAEIARINAGVIREKKKAEDEYITELLKKQFALFDNQEAQNNIKSNNVINNPFSSQVDKAKAELEKLQNEGDKLDKEIGAILVQLAQGKGDISQLHAQLDELITKRDQNENAQDIDKLKITMAQLEAISSKASGIGNVFKNMASGVSGLNKGLGEALATLGEMAGTVANVAQGIKEFKSAKSAGDTLGQITSVVGIATTITSFVLNVIAQTKQSIQDALDKMKNFRLQQKQGEFDITLEYRERARLQQDINNLTLQGIEAQKALLAQQKLANQSQASDLLKQLQNATYVSAQKGKVTGLFQNKLQIEDVFSSLAGKTFEEIEALYAKGQLSEKAKALFEQLNKIKQEGADIDKQLKELQDQSNQIFTGTTAQNIADSIKDGLASGKKSVADFADDFNSLLTNAILSSFEAKEIEPAIEEFYKKFAELSSGSGGALSADQIQQLRDLYNNDINDFTSKLQQLQQIAGINIGGANQNNALAGAIKGMTEQTAELLAGQFGGLRLTAVEQLNIAKAALDVQNNIANSTAQTVIRLNTMLDYWQAVTTGAKKIFVQ
jgi:hypothetical protein